MYRKTMALVAVMVMGMLVGGIADARKKAGVQMPDRIQVGGKTLVLNGMGVREATALKVDVYVAGLYLEQPSSEPAEILGTPQMMRIHMQFLRDVGQDDIVNAWQEGFEKNTRPAVLPAIQDRIARLGSWMTDMERGDTLTFTYVPGHGTEVQVNGERRGVIEGDDFGRALFSIWLGPQPPNPGLKTGMLGQ